MTKFLNNADIKGYIAQTAVTSYLLKADSTGRLVAAIAGTDYQAPTTALLPSGGTAGQILAKIDGTNYNTQWIDNFAQQIKYDVKLGAALSKGTPVYVSSANGTNIIVSASSNSTEATSSKTLGLLETGGALNDIVKVVSDGLLSGLNTSTATIGDPVWLGVNGALIFGLANKPSAPAHLVYIGAVTRVHATNGEIFIKVQNGFELDELHNVALSSVADGQGLFYESATSLWKNKTIASVLGYTPANGANYLPLTGGTISGDLTISSSNPRLYFTDTDNNPDYFISNTDGTFTIYDVTNSAGKFKIYSTGSFELNGVVGIGTTTTSAEGNLFLGAKSATEGGQLVLQKGTSQTYAAHIDNYVDQFRIIAGTDTTSSALKFTLNLNTGQAQFPNYNSATAFSGTVVGYLAFDSGGNLLTVASVAATDNTKLPLAGGTLTGGLNGTTASFSGNVTTSANYIISSGLTLFGNHISTQWYNGADTVFVNYVGYNGGTTQFRNFHIYDGKQGVVAMFDGSAKSLTLNGNLSVNNGANTTVSLNGSAFVGIEYSRASSIYGFVGTENSASGGMRYNSVNGNYEHNFYTNSILSFKLSSTGAATFSNTISAGNSISSTGGGGWSYLANTQPTWVTQLNVGYAGDYNQHVILLCPIYNSTLIDYNKVVGTIYASRGSSGSGLISDTYNVDVSSAYSGVTGFLNSTGGAGALYTCMYGGVKYLALIPTYRTSAVSYTFTGYFAKSTGSSLLLISYYNSQTSTVLNSEINSSLTAFTPGTQYFGGPSAFANTITATGFVKSGGTSAQFLKADGSVDSSTYLTTSSASSTYLPLAGGTLSGFFYSSVSSKIVVQGSNDGGSGRGIFMWNATDPNWGIYMAQAGASKTIADTTAPSGIDSRTEHAIRFRVAASTTQIGFLWENSNDVALMQLQPNTGNLYTRGQIYAGNSTSNLVYHSGNLTNLNQLTNGPGYITGYTETDTLATVTGRGASTSTTLNLDGRVNIGNGLSRPDSLNSNSVAHARIGGADVHLYVASLGAGGAYKVAVQAARISDFQSFGLDLQSNGGTLFYGGSEVATRTYVSSYALPLTGGTISGSLNISGTWQTNISTTGGWSKLSFTASNAWGDGATTYGVLGVSGGNEPGVMINNMHATWVSTTNGAGVRMGRSGGVSTGAWYQVATMSSDEFMIAKTGDWANGGIKILSNGAVNYGNTGYRFVHNNGTWDINVTGSAGSVAWGNVSSKPSLVMYYQGFTLDANTMDGNSTGFTYSVNAPYTGPIARFSETGYSLQLNAAYGGGGTQIAYRTRNGDAASWNNWYAFITSANIGSQSVNYANSAGSASTAGTASSAGSVTHSSGRTDSAYYNVLWGAGNPSLLYSADGVQIQSSTNTLRAQNLTANGNLYAGSQFTALGTNGTYQLSRTFGISGADYKHKYILLARVPTFGNASVNCAFRGRITSDRVNELGMNVDQDISLSIGYGNNVYWNTEARAGNTYSLVVYNYGGTNYLALYIYTAPNYYQGTFTGMVSDFGSWLDGNFLTVVELASANHSAASYNQWTSTIMGNAVLHAANYTTYTIPLNGNWSGNTGMNDQKLYLRTNGDNNHYFWNAADDWEELVAYNGTGFRINTSTGTTLANFSSSYINFPQAPSGASLTLGGVDNSRVYNDSNRQSLVINAPYYPHLYLNATNNANNTTHGPVISMTGVKTGGGFRRWGMGIANTDPGYFSIGWYDNDSNPHYGVGHSWSNGGRFIIDTAGNIWCTGDVTAYGAQSDARLKTIKGKVPNALDGILKLNGYRFDWKERDVKITTFVEDIGVIAQEVAEVFPELAREGEDGWMSVRYQGLTAVLIEAVKEQQTQIKSQNEEIVKLKDLITQLLDK